MEGTGGRDEEEGSIGGASETLRVMFEVMSRQGRGGLEGENVRTVRDCTEHMIINDYQNRPSLRTS